MKQKADFTDAVIDNAFEGGYMAGRYLIERGHREIGVIPGPLNVTPAQAALPVL